MTPYSKIGKHVLVAHDKTITESDIGLHTPTLHKGAAYLTIEYILLFSQR